MKNTLILGGLAAAILAGGVLQAAAENHGKMNKGPRHSFEDLDADGDGQITKAEMEGHMQARFQGADSDGNGTLSKDELVARMTERAAARMAKYADHMIEKHDADGDGQLTMDEMKARHEGRMFKRMDANEDGAISRQEFDAARSGHGGKHGHGHGKMNKSE